MQFDAKLQATLTTTVLAICLLTVQLPAARGADFVTRKGNVLLLNGKPFRFAGPNCYWLGLDENVGGIAYPSPFRVDDALATAENMGATVVRAHTLGVSVGNPLSVEPALNKFNANALKVIDYAIRSAQTHGLRLIIPLMDNYHYYHGGKHTFTDWRNISDENAFYTNPTVIADFERYVSTLLTHVNTYTGIAYRDDPTILAWETGNEITPPATWTATIARYIKSVDTHHLVLDGTYGINAAALNLPQVDMVSDHFYPLDANRLATDAQTAQKASKVFVAGEVGWSDPLTDLPGFLQTALQTAGVSGDLYWSLFPHLDTFGFVPHPDGFTLHYPGDDADQASAAQELRNHAYAMQGIKPSLPDVLPLAPQITSIDSFGNIAWRGAANAATYQVESATKGTNGPWSVLTHGIVTDNATPWMDPVNTQGGRIWYRVRGANLQSKSGPYSSVYAATLYAQFIDPMANLNLASSHTANWAIDTSNPQYLGGEPHRATRTVDDSEALIYSLKGLKSFSLRIYSKQTASALSGFVHLYASLHGGQSYALVPWSAVRSWPGGTNGGWTGYAIEPDAALPAGADGLKIVFTSGSGFNWDPQLARVTLGH